MVAAQALTQWKKIHQEKALPEILEFYNEAYSPEHILKITSLSTMVDIKSDIALRSLIESSTIESSDDLVLFAIDFLGSRAKIGLNIDSIKRQLIALSLNSIILEKRISAIKTFYESMPTAYSTWLSSEPKFFNESDRIFANSLHKNKTMNNE